MRLVVVDSSHNQSLPAESVVVLGNIDGFHRGHQELVRQGKVLAEKLMAEKPIGENPLAEKPIGENPVAEKPFGGMPIAGEPFTEKLPVWVATFNPHPIEILKPKAGFQRLFSLKHQQELLSQAGVDGIYYFRFDQEMSKVSAMDFLNQYLAPKLNPKAIVVGFNFRFGHGRSGGPEELKAWGADKGIKVVIVPSVEWKNEVVSSTQVRKYLQIGQVKAAHEILGFPFFIEGLVEKGAGRGRTLGFPTANMSCPSTQIPAFGVYATTVLFNGKKLPSISHLGPLPSFGDAQARLETHVLRETMKPEGKLSSEENWNFSNQILKVEFLDRVRDVQKFESAESLSAQIQKDILRAREIHGKT